MYVPDMFFNTSQPKKTKLDRRQTRTIASICNKHKTQNAHSSLLIVLCQCSVLYFLIFGCSFLID